LTIKTRNTNRNCVTVARGWNAEEPDVSLIYQRLNNVGFIP
jgi:hypothetical protein